MTEESSNPQSSLVPSQRPDIDIRTFEATLLSYMGSIGLPTTSVFVDVSERGVVFKNAERVIELINSKTLPDAVYISKFLAAVAAGLFDAALNYIWDQTILELRQRVAQYDLDYFFDVAVKDPSKRNKLKSEEDLAKIDDSELIRGAREIELISELGFKHLDFIRYMRNWASAAHPNQNQITGLQIISWLETCIREVINLPLSNIVVEIKRLLGNIKTNRILDDDARQIAVFFADLTQERIDTLCAGFFGIYTQLDTTTQTRQNIQHLLPYLWDRVSEKVRQELGVKYAQFLARNEQQQQVYAKQFLEIVAALSYLPEGILVAEIETAIDNLLQAHRGFNNFYNEPTFARQLQRIVGETRGVPRQINTQYVMGLVEVYLTNGNGIAWNAENIYINLIRQFDAKQVWIATLAFMAEHIASKLQFSLCQTKFRELLQMMREQTPTPAVKELIEIIENHNAPLDKLREVSDIRRRVDNLRRIM